MSNVIPKVHLRLNHDAPMLDLARPYLNLWCMPCVQVPSILRNNYLIIIYFIKSQIKLIRIFLMY